MGDGKMCQGFDGDGRDCEEEDERAWPGRDPEDREHAIVSMWRDGFLDRLTRSPSETERRVAQRLIAEARRITGEDSPW